MKDFTLYPEALELKQLGFDEPCFAFYDEGLYFPNNENQYGTFCNQKLDASSCSAPTYSQAFRWFRDNGKVVEIFSQLLPSNKYKWGFKIQGVEGITDGFFTYEEAELACLKEMIKIVKNNYGKQ
jgi:hypothetical protein